MMIRKLAGLVAGATLVLAACGDDGGAPSAADPAPTGSTTEMPGETPTEASAEASEAMSSESSESSETSGEASGDVSSDPTSDEAVDTTEPSGGENADAFPLAIVSLSPTATEMLYAIGAGEQVLAVDDFSNHPAEAAEKMQGLSGFQPNVEAIAGLEPDLVITDGTNADLLAQLDGLGIPHWEGPAAASFDDVYTQIEQLGAATGHVGEAAELVAAMQTDVAAVKQGLPELAEPLTYYHELDPTFFSVTSATFIGAVYDEIGLVNIADAVGDGSPYPQLNAEFIVAENPDLIFLACTLYCGETAETVAARPGWESLDAVLGGAVVEMNDDIASRWGPRIVEYLRVAGEAVAQVAAAQTTG